MSNINSRLIVGAIPVLLGLLIIYLEPTRDLLSQNFDTYGLFVSTPVVHDIARNVKYIGSIEDGVEHFQNIFYAEDTSGKNRFAPPVKFEPPPGSSIDATKPGAWCSQGTGDVLPFTSKVTNVSENCLSLRIARPRALQSDAKLPVIVWLHGGGHALGSGYEILYKPDGLVKQAAVDNQPVIYVGINYRLGIFGFATSDALVKAKHTNAGLRDQRAALEWVRDHIEAFGGDPTKVTAVGQSVGASDISLQLTAFAGRDPALFSKAVLMSGGPGLNFNTRSDLVRNNTASIAEQVDCTKGGSQSPAAVACLRAVPADRLTELAVSASRAARPPFGEGYFFPTFDGDFIPDRPSELMRAGRFAKNIPVIASWVTNDGAWYAPPTTSTDQDVLSTFGLWLQGHSQSTKDELLRLYPLSDFEHMVRPELDGPISAQYYRAAQMNRDLWFTCPVVDFAWQYVRNGGAAPADVRLYEHNATRFLPAFEMMGVSMWRVSHLSDIPYMFNNPTLLDNSKAQMDLSRLMSRSIARFANAGTPEGTEGGVDRWPPAFSGVADKELKASFPRSFALHLFGGPHGSTPVRVSKGLDGNLSEVQKSVKWERILERCEFINSDRVRKESGV